MRRHFGKFMMRSATAAAMLTASVMIASYFARVDFHFTPSWPGSNSGAAMLVDGSLIVARPSPWHGRIDMPSPIWSYSLTWQSWTLSAACFGAPDFRPPDFYSVRGLGYFIASIPIWWIVLALAALAFIARSLNRITRPTCAGHCRVCGYDLRATPERCPECGTRVAPPGTIAPSLSG
jgi:hypothetical protein